MNIFDKYQIPVSREVMIPIEDLKTGKKMHMFVKEGSRLHKFYMQVVNCKRDPVKYKKENSNI